MDMTERPSVLLTLGRFPKALALARALNAAGFNVLVAEPFQWHLCRVSRAVSQSFVVCSPNVSTERYLSDLANIVSEHRVNLVIPVSEESHFVCQLKRRLPDDVEVFAPQSNHYETLHHKLRFAEWAEQKKLTVPETHMLGSVRGTRLAALRDTVIKPVAGCSGIGVRVHKAGEPLPTSTGGAQLIQALVSGRLVSTLSVVRNGQLLGSVMYQGNVFAGSVAICFDQITMPESIHQWIGSLIHALEDYHGFLAFDFIIDQDNVPWAIECNPRLTSGIHFLDAAHLAKCLARGDDPAAHAKILSGRKQWFYSTLTEAYACLFKGRVKAFVHALGQLITSRDVVWSWRDPLPFLLMTPLSLGILWPAVREGISLGEASQRDIAPHWHSSEAD